MFTELIITIWLFVTGFVFCNHVFKSRDILNKLIFAFPISSTYTVIFFQLLSICSIKISYFVIIISEVVKLLSLLKFRDPHFIDNLKYIVPYTVIIIFPFFLIPWMTHDSSMFALYAESIKTQMF